MLGNVEPNRSRLVWKYVCAYYKIYKLRIALWVHNISGQLMQITLLQSSAISDVAGNLQWGPLIWSVFKPRPLFLGGKTVMDSPMDTGSVDSAEERRQFVTPRRLSQLLLQPPSFFSAAGGCATTGTNRHNNTSLEDTRCICILIITQYSRHGSHVKLAGSHVQRLSLSLIQKPALPISECRPLYWWCWWQPGWVAAVEGRHVGEWEEAAPGASGHSEALTLYCHSRARYPLPWDAIKIRSSSNAYSRLRSDWVTAS